MNPIGWASRTPPKATRTRQQKQLFNDTRPSWVEVDVKRMRVENRRDFGGPWLGLQLVEQLGWKDFFDRTLPDGREEIPRSLMTLVLILCRLCEPSSELHIAEHYYAQSALVDLLGIAPEKINEQRLYRALDAIPPHKETLETFLKNRLGELFGIEYDLLLYDVTSTYFEGQADGNPLAQRGYSRDHRPDCKQVCIGLVVSKCGMPPGYEVFAGTALGRLASNPRRLGSQAVSVAGRRRNLRALPQPRSPRERKGHARPFRAADRGGIAAHRGRL